jgi:hypothetical protein
MQIGYPVPTLRRVPHPAVRFRRIDFVRLGTSFSAIMTTMRFAILFLGRAGLLHAGR